MAFFFFSSRRRHTRCGRDWSSDVCSSDLVQSQRKRGREHGCARTVLHSAVVLPLEPERAHGSRRKACLNQAAAGANRRVFWTLPLPGSSLLSACVQRLIDDGLAAGHAARSRAGGGASAPLQSTYGGVVRRVGEAAGGVARPP